MSIETNLSPQWIEGLFRQWQNAPQSLSPDWQAFFQGFELASVPPAAPISPDTMDATMALKESAVQSLLYRYRDLGHLLACTDPLSPCPVDHPLLRLDAFGLEDTDLDRTFHSIRFLKTHATLREMLKVLRETYCRAIGVEFMHIQDPAERDWLKMRMESIRNQPVFTWQEKKTIYRKLAQAAQFENFLHRKFLGQKRFSLEGGEVLIPFLDGAVCKAGELGMTDLILGMAHRGRLNVLANIFQKPLESIFAEFQDNVELAFVGEGDVKYHKGFSRDVALPGGHNIHMTLASNPSHLEAVNPVVEGKVRARQDGRGADGEKRILPVLIHGDAAFSGQGMVAEILNLSQLEGYRTGGTLHVVLNNQIGFTTSPRDARSTLYATDVAKMLKVPVFHVHGENPEAVVYLAGLALDYRQTFGKDVVVEIICFRRHGHNEGDEPYFTQPLMYDRIKERPPVHDIYAEVLAKEGMKEAELKAIREEITQTLEDALERPQQSPPMGFTGKWEGIERSFSHAPVDTHVDRDKLSAMAESLATVPDGFTPHPKIAKLLQGRLEAVQNGEGIDWGNAETLAYASLLSEGHTIRLSGQDCRRGTFNHRHAVLIDINNEATYSPLEHLQEGQAPLHVYNSMLSEAAVLGFEYGYSLEGPNGLTIWEAQFGDFANGAQVIIDQFIASSLSKWERATGLTMFLPHGYEGQGAEHSSARMERYLQLAADDNILVVYPSTPAQMFHLLRRQVKQSFRRPLIVFTPKSLLRLPACRSTLADLAEGPFQQILVPDVAADQVRTVLLCSGKIYYELEERRQKEERDDVAICRIEQLFPLHSERLQEILKGYKQTDDFRWVQEEPKNGGAWSFIEPYLRDILGSSPTYIGRPPMAAPAVGSHRLHQKEQDEILSAAFAD